MIDPETRLDASEVDVSPYLTSEALKAFRAPILGAVSPIFGRDKERFGDVTVTRRNHVLVNTGADKFTTPASDRYKGLAEKFLAIANAKLGQELVADLRFGLNLSQLYNHEHGGDTTLQLFSKRIIRQEPDMPNPDIKAVFAFSTHAAIINDQAIEALKVNEVGVVTIDPAINLTENVDWKKYGRIALGIFYE